MQVKPLVFDSTPLIYLTKVGLCNIFEDSQVEKCTSPLVKKEVVDKGKIRGIPDSLVLDRLFDKGIFKVCEPADKKCLGELLKTHGLHVADADVLALTNERDGIAVSDDEVARKTAKVYGIEYVGSFYVLVRAICEGIISVAHAKKAVGYMVSSGWRCSVESYVKIMEAIEKL